MAKQGFIFNDAGPAAVYWDGNDMGPTFGGVNFRAEQANIDLKEDAHGEANVGQITNGETASVNVPLTRTSLTRLARIFPNATLAGNKLTVKNPVGEDLYDAAKTLILKPMVNGVATVDTTKWITFFKAAPTHALELNFGGDQRVIECTFVAYVDQDSANFGKMYEFGA